MVYICLHGKFKWASFGFGQVLISDEELKGIFDELEQWGHCVWGPGDVSAF